MLYNYNVYLSHIKDVICHMRAEPIKAVWVSYKEILVTVLM